MKKIMILLIFVLTLTTTTLLFANTDKEIEKIPSGAPKTDELEAGIENKEDPTAGSLSVNREENPSELELNDGIILINQYHLSFIEDERGNRHTFESLDYGKDAREARELKEKKSAEDKAAEASKNESALKEETQGAKNSSSKAAEASGNSEAESTSNTSTASATKASTESKSSAEITTVAATPPRSPNVPSYSMDSIGIYHNDEGAVTVVYPNAPQKRLRVLVEKGGERSAYNLHDGTTTGNAVATYPLQRGEGTYLVRIMENTEGNSYREVYRQEVTFKSQQKHGVYLNSIQEINWSTSDPAIQKASQLTAGVSSDREKVRAIYNHVVRNVKYDHDKVNQLNIFYLPNINDTFSTNKGICYDYASLFAAMLRSQGIPTRMVKGYSDAVGNGEVYHAWNEVYLAGEDRWVIIDTTHDASRVQAGHSVDMIKGSGGFSVTHRL